jgi:hypothetical protein
VAALDRPPQVFSNITPERYAALVQKASAAGINLAGNSGIASNFGVEVKWDYSPESRELTFQVLSTPVFLTAEPVDARIKAMVEETAG